jgi:hypothetical protein
MFCAKRDRRDAMGRDAKIIFPLVYGTLLAMVPCDHLLLLRHFFSLIDFLRFSMSCDRLVSLSFFSPLLFIFHLLSVCLI